MRIHLPAETVTPILVAALSEQDDDGQEEEGARKS